MAAKPETIEQAVQEVLTWGWAKKPEQVDLVRGMLDEDLPELHFSLGMAIRNNTGLWQGNVELLRACGVTHPDDASSVLLKALRDHIVATSTPEQLANARRARAKRMAEGDAHRRRKAEKDAGITDRRCPKCGLPCPKYRKTCGYCRFEIGREPS